MIKQKIIGWAILFIYAISLLIIFKLKLLGNWDEEKLSMSLFAIYTFVIPSIAWYFIKKQMKKESQRHSRTLFSVQQKKLTFCSFSNGRMKPSSLCRFPTLLFPLILEFGYNFRIMENSCFDFFKKIMMIIIKSNKNVIFTKETKCLI